MSDGLFGEPKPAETWPGVQAVEARTLAERVAKRLVRLENRLEKTRDRLKALESERTLAKGYASNELKVLRKALAQVMDRLEDLEARLARLEGGPQPVAKAQGLPLGEVMGLLARIITDPARVAVAEHHANRGDLAAALSVLTLEERAEVARVLQGL